MNYKSRCRNVSVRAMVFPDTASWVVLKCFEFCYTFKNVQKHSNTPISWDQETGNCWLLFIQFFD